MISLSIFFLVVNLLSKPTHSFKLLLLGDSIDRMAVDDWCTLKQSQRVRANLTNSWCEEYLIGRDVGHKWPCFSCETDEDVIASVHLYGSGDKGPYHHKDDNDIYEATAIRLPLMIAKFISIHGLPDRVMYHTNQWDSRCGETDAWKAHKPENLFINDTLKRIEQIQQIFDYKVDLGLRSAAWSARGGNMIHTYNNIVRNISLEKNLTFYDLSEDMWSTMDHDKEMEWRLFRDAIHPLPPYTSRLVEKLLENQYTNALKLRSPSETMKYNKKFDDNFPSTSLIAPLWLDDTTNSIYYFNDLNSSWHYMPDRSFMKALRYGPKDVRSFDSSTIQKLTSENLASPTPTFFVDGSVFNKTSVPQLYHYGYSYITNISNARPDLSLICNKESGIPSFCS